MSEMVGERVLVRKENIASISAHTSVGGGGLGEQEVGQGDV